MPRLYDGDGRLLLRSSSCLCLTGYGHRIAHETLGGWRLLPKDLTNEVLLLVARHRGDGRHRGACGRRELRAQRRKFVWRGSPSRRVLSGVVVSAASLAEDEWKRFLLLDSLHRLRAQRAVPVDHGNQISADSRLPKQPSCSPVPQKS